MLPALYDDQRESLARLAVMLIVGTLAVLPMTVPTNASVRAAEAQDALAVRMPIVPTDIPAVAVAPKRDPFIADTRASATFAPVEDADTGLPDVVLPPNAGAYGVPPGRGAGAAPIVRALVLGAHSRALIDLGGQVSVFGLGDRVGDATIASIDAGGVVLSNGTRLPLVEEAP